MSTQFHATTTASIARLGATPQSAIAIAARLPGCRRALHRWLAAAFCIAAPVMAQAAGGVTTDPVALTRTYHGSDGSAFTTREVGNTIVGFSEDLSGQRAFVFNGTRSGFTISGTYYAVPAGANTATGPLVLTYANGGSTLTRTGGDDIGPPYWLAKLPSAFSYPKERAARFQSLSSNDLDGVFKAGDGTRAYVRQYGSQVVYVAERFADANAARPTYSTLVIAQRGADGALNGFFYDLPKQTAPLRAGRMGGQAYGKPRQFTQGTMVSPITTWTTFSADYAVDFDRFAQEITERLTPVVVGFNYAIARNGELVRSGAGGARRAVTATNGLGAPVPYTAYTVIEISSTTKIVTLVAVLKALRQRGISVDSPVSPYLPATWARGTGMNTVTFRQLLSHGMKPTVGNGMFKPNDCGTDFYGCLRDAVATGMNAACRLRQHPLRDLPRHPAVRARPAGHGATVRDREPRDGAQRVLQHGVPGRDPQPAGAGRRDGGFRLPGGIEQRLRLHWGTPPTNENAPTGSEDDYLHAGPGGLKMSSREFAQFLSRLEKGELLSAADLATAKAIGFGGTGPIDGPSGVGPVWGKNGGSGGRASQAMVFPGVEVFITQNSTGNAAQTNNSDDVDPGLASRAGQRGELRLAPCRCCLQRQRRAGAATRMRGWRASTQSSSASSASR